MSQVKYFPINSTPDQKFGEVVLYPNGYDPTKKYMTWLIGHGQGEQGNGSQEALEKVFNWPGWENIKLAVDKYQFIAVFLNTSGGYSAGEWLWTLNWAKKNLPVDENLIFALGHSLGSFGLGRFGLPDAEFSKGIRGWFVSAAGPYNSNKAFPNIASNDILVWGITAQNDKVSGTDPVWVTQLDDKILPLNPNAHVIVMEYPSTTWADNKTLDNGVTGSTIAHNAVLGRLTAINSTLTPDLTKGKVLTSPIKMNIYQWALSNPKGSIYQEPTGAFVGPKYSTPPEPPITPPKPPTMPTTVKRNGFTLSDDKATNSLILQLWWENGEEKITVRSVYFSDKSDRIDVVLPDGTKKSFNNTKTI